MIDPGLLVEIAYHLRTLAEQRRGVTRAFERLESAIATSDEREAARKLALEHPGVRTLGWLLAADETDRATALSLLGKAQRTFVGSLTDRIGSRPGFARALAAVLPGSFAPASAVAWEQYRTFLREQPDLPIWGDPQGSGIRRIYVAPPFTEEAHTGRQERGRNLAVHVDPMPLVLDFVDAPDGAAQPVFVLGGPGVGKTSFAQMLAARLAERHDLYPVLVRLRLVEPERPLLAEIARVLKDQGHGEVGTSLDQVPRPVLVLDGFDELAQATKSRLTAFFFQVKDLLRNPGLPGTRIVLTGRDALFAPEDAAIPEGARLVTLTPFSDAQVAEWSRKWREVRGGAFDAARLLARGAQGVRERDSGATSGLGEIARQPLMLYMLARMSEEGLDLAATGATDRGQTQVFRRIIDWCCKRHEDLRPDDTWKAHDMRRFLRLAGYVAMVRGREVLHIEDLEAGIRQTGIEDPGSDRMRFLAEKTILSFAFRTPDQRAWEFTHKSFGEYLAAEHVAGTCTRLTLLDADGAFVLDDPSAAKAWIGTFGTALLPHGVEAFLVPILETALAALRERLVRIYARIVDEDDAEEVVRTARAWGQRPTFVRGFALASAFAIAGLPELDGSEHRFQPEATRTGNSWDACRAVEGVGPFSYLDAMRVYGRLHLGGLSAVGGFLPFVSFRGSDLKGRALSRAFLFSTDFTNADLRGTHLEQAYLSFAVLESADLRGARLEGASWSKDGVPNVRGCRLDGLPDDATDEQRLQRLRELCRSEPPNE
ncbi:MAG: pentapeptide repeat-containing protein [Deltaproteobacteria bacterium]|nr:pentapeptide repeat-containing protein [Deltaproteobacteria bacterium]